MAKAIQDVLARVGGTSAVAPLMAALVALLNQGKGTNVSFLNPFLYVSATKGISPMLRRGTSEIVNAVEALPGERRMGRLHRTRHANGTAIPNLL